MEEYSDGSKNFYRVVKAEEEEEEQREV